MADDGTIYGKIGFLIGTCLIFLGNSVMVCLRFLAGYAFRIKVNESNDSSFLESSELNEVNNFDKKDENIIDKSIEKRMPTFSFKHQSSNLAEIIRKIEEEEKGDEFETINTNEKENQSYKMAPDSHNYRFLSEKNFCGFMEEPETATFRVHESFIGFEEENYRFLSVEDFMKSPMESIFGDGIKSDDYGILNSLNKRGDAEDFADLKYSIIEDEKSNSLSSETTSTSGREIKFITEDFSDIDFESDIDSSSDGYSVKELAYDSVTDDFLSETGFREEDNDSENKINSVNSINKLEHVQHESFFLERSDDDDSDHDHLNCNNEEVVEESRAEELLLPVEEEEITIKSNSDELFAENQSSEKRETELYLPESEDFSMKIAKSRDTASSPTVKAFQIEIFKDSIDHELSSVKNGSIDALDREDMREKTEEKPNYDSTVSVKVFEATEQKIKESDACKELKVEKKETEESKSLKFDSEELDELWEHQELIDQLKMELKRVRAVGLPTILEESESPMTIDDLKPFKIDEEFLSEDPLDELQKFYKCYRERMRKLDILNYQKMHVMGFLQLKNPLHSIGDQKPLFSTIMSHLSQSLLPFCQKKHENNPLKKVIKDLQCDLEIIYVGQMCLSWEFLRWQYEKSHELLELDPHRRCHYNKVAGEFQQFQVLVQRFTENEQFQGPRLPNYIKQRCVLRNLLQVPVIKEDTLKNDMGKGETNDAITSEMLEDIMEEAIRIFWEFIKVEKHETPFLIKIFVENNAEVQEPSDYEFMAKIEESLQKKEKKLKDILRTGNCIVKKFKKPQEDRSNQDLFFSQVDLKLVSRVLKMSRITSEQLLWCHQKLSKITFNDRKLHREPSFLLFPC